MNHEGIISGTNAHAVKASARHMIKAGAFWHRGAMKTYAAPVIGTGGFGKLEVFSITLDRKERRRPRLAIIPIAAKGVKEVRLSWIEIPNRKGESHGR